MRKTIVNNTTVVITTFCETDHIPTNACFTISKGGSIEIQKYEPPEPLFSIELVKAEHTINSLEVEIVEVRE